MNKEDIKTKIEEWLLQIDSTEYISVDIHALHFGLFETDNGFGLYLSGSKQYDEMNDDWACLDDYEPARKYLFFEDVEMDWQPFLYLIEEAVSDIMMKLSKIENSVFHARIVAVGFDDGNLKRIQ